MLTTIQIWVMGIILHLVPMATDWQGTYASTSYAIAKESTEHPFSGFTEQESAAFLTDFAYTESRFNPNAMGDCHSGVSQSTCQSFGLYQISKVHAPISELLGIDSATAHARRLLDLSMRICASKTKDKMFAWYAAGGVDCNEKGWHASEYRYGLAKGFLRDYPLP